jgi:NAD(P)-dependent dehydrogenase (short-subunit alcohol dehydrogenase family)
MAASETATGTPPQAANLEGQGVVVTGAGRGLGRAYALAAAAAGARIIVNDVAADTARETTEMITAAGGTAAMLAGPVQDPGTAEALVSEAQARFGRLDGFVVNAGLFHVASPFDETAERLRPLVEVNVLGAMLCGVAALRTMREQHHGSLVLVTSGARFGMSGISSYGATKAAVASLAVGWAAEAAADHVRVNAISPLAETPMLALNPDAGAAPPPDAIAPLVVFLLSDAAAGVTGQIIRLDGRRLSIYPPPEHPRSLGEREAWTAPEIAAAFAAFA